MLIPPKYFLTSKITELLASIESCKGVIDSVTIPVEVEQNIRRKSTLKSSLFSARIEGSSLTLEELPKLSSSDQKRVEVYNILRGLNWIQERSARDITLKDILNLHALSMRHLVEESTLGKLRSTQEGVTTSYGFIIYHAPPPGQISKLLERLLKYINSEKEPLPAIRAVLAHYTFEKIHPFIDGSGRVGRLLMQMVLAKSGYGMKGILPFEEAIDKRRETYYRNLAESERDLTDYVEFMLEVINASAIESKNTIMKKQSVNKADFLLPRRAEIYQLIKDQKLLNFDSVKRRFSNVNSRTLRYDLKKLQDQGFIVKLGSTRGVYYKLRNSKEGVSE